MSEQEQQQAEQPVDHSRGLVDIYIKKLEAMYMDVVRRLATADMNVEVLQNSLRHANELYQSANEQLQIALRGIHDITIERNQLRDTLAKQDAGMMEASAAVRERDSAYKQRDDYQRELQNHIKKCNDLNAIVEQQKIVIAEQNATIEKLNKLAVAEPKKKVAKVK